MPCALTKCWCILLCYVTAGLFMQMADRELSRGMIYTQRAMRLAQGNGVESVAPSSAQSAPEQGSTLTLQQKMKQFDAARREQWQEQIEV